MQVDTDRELRLLARKRVAFRAHLLSYCIINSILWLVWIFTGRNYPWPIWPTFGWGIGLVFHYMFDYRPSKFLSEEEEYNKLKRASQQHDRLVQ